MKWCRRCERIKSVDDFPLHRGLSDGRQTYCRECAAEYYRRKREAAGLLARPAVPAGHKFCRGCEQIKPLSDWSPRAHTSDGFDFRCRECRAKWDRTRHLARMYRMSEQDVTALLSAQGGVCAICGVAPAVHIDHDHASGAVRGMLCFRCNAALGQFDDQPERLRKAAEYIERARGA